MKERLRKYGGIVSVHGPSIVELLGIRAIFRKKRDSDALAIYAVEQDGFPGYRVETGASEDVPSYGYNLKSQI
jgi:hypothetical protein